MTPTFRDVQHCRFWVARHLADGQGFAGTLLKLSEAVDAERLRPRSPQALFELVEIIRCAVSAPAKKLVDQVAGSLKLPDAQFSADLHALDTLMDRLRLASMAADTAGGPDSGDTTRQQMPGTRTSPAEVLPLARALQLQSMRIIAMLRTRTVVPDVLWHELGDLALAMRQSTFIDELLGKDDDPDGNRTARAWFALPLLLRIAALEERQPNQASLINRLAGYWADRVGFRIDSIKTVRTNKYGPSLKLGIEYRVRLDTHRLRDSMVRRQSKWFNPQTDASQLPMGFSRVQLADLLEDLFIRWSPAWRAPKRRPAPGGAVRMRFGLPSRELLFSGRTGSSYDYGHYQHEGSLEITRPAESLARLATQVLRGADRGQWSFVDRQGVVVDRHASESAPALSGIVAFAIEPGPNQIAPGDGSFPRINHTSDEPVLQGLRLGRVKAIQRVSEAGPDNDSHRLAMETFEGVPTPVEIQDNAGTAVVGAYLLSGKTADHPATLFVPLSHISAGVKLVLRRPDDQVSVEIGQLVTRGPDYEQYVVNPRGAGTI
ncbi:MAG: hypothetical protein ACRBC3_13650 [Burkholderiaceae bacterium]